MLNVNDYLEESVTDGPGVRFVLFLQGCPHHCKGCHNPQTWVFEDKHLMEVDDIFEVIKRNKLLTGITFSGGEPMEQADELIKLAKLCKDNNYSVIMYTGYLFEEIKHDILKYIDYVVDGEFIEEKRSLDCLYRGSTNQRIIDVAASLKENKTVEVDYDNF